MGLGEEQLPDFPDRLGSQWLIVLQFIEMFLVFYPLLFQGYDCGYCSLLLPHWAGTGFRQWHSLAEYSLALPTVSNRLWPALASIPFLCHLVLGQVEILFSTSVCGKDCTGFEGCFFVLRDIRITVRSLSEVFQSLSQKALLQL